MSIFDVFKRQPVQSQDGLRRIWSQAPKTETTRLPQLFHQSPRLDPVALIASTIASCPLELFDKVKHRKDGKEAEPLLDHPFYDLIENPSTMFPELDGYAVKYITVVLTELLGECFWIKLRSGAKVTEILPMPPAWCIMTPTEANPRFMFQPFGTTAQKTISVPPEDVVWFKQPDITDPYGRGRGRTEAVGDELDTDEMAAKWQKNYFYNDATPPLWANLPGVSMPDLERARDTWMQRLGGWLNARKPVFTNSEGITITKLGDTSKEMDFVESRKYMRDTFLQHYSIPPELFGILESSNRSTIDAAEYLFGKNVIERRLGLYERTITRQLIAPDYDNRLIAKISFDIPEDEAFKLQKVNEGLTRGALTRADWKKAMGYRVDKGDEVYLLPFSLTEVPKGSTREEVRPEPKEEPIIELVDDDPEPVKAQKSIDARKAAHWKAADNRATQGESTFRNRTRAYAEVQAKRVKKALEAKGPKAYKSAIESAFSGADEALMHAYAPAWLQSMTDGAEIGRAFLGMKASPSFALYNKAFDKWIKNNGLKKCADINTTTHDMLLLKMEDTLAEGIEAGESMDKLAARLFTITDEVYLNMSEARAQLIARTETMTSVNFGQFTVYKEEGVEKKEWLATPDEITRADHAATGGKIVSVDDPFIVGGEEMMYPGDVQASAGNICNCRCTIIPVIEL